MNKTYTLQKAQLTEVEKNNAIMHYHLIDDKGNQRVVHAVAKLGCRKKIKSVQAKYYRETPLVDVLSQAKVQQRVEVSYTKFNKHPRISLLKDGRKTFVDPMFKVADDETKDGALISSIEPPNYLTLALLALSAFMLWAVIQL